MDAVKALLRQQQRMSGREGNGPNRKVCSPMVLQKGLERAGNKYLDSQVA